ncbi:hypothetical protein [Paraburkholderia strydomiana]|uniref:hypothetical protein n=1 Tax=Paraburkholderia strydomiana TaxID=1245417 RepID=UPI0038BB95C4
MLADESAQARMRGIGLRALVPVGRHLYRRQFPRRRGHHDVEMLQEMPADAGRQRRDQIGFRHHERRRQLA